jgi:hypothetical protein
LEKAFWIFSHFFVFFSYSMFSSTNWLTSSVKSTTVVYVRTRSFLNFTILAKCPYVCWLGKTSVFSWKSSSASVGSIVYYNEWALVTLIYFCWSNAIPCAWNTLGRFNLGSTWIDEICDNLSFPFFM